MLRDALRVARRGLTDDASRAFLSDAISTRRTRVVAVRSADELDNDLTLWLGCEAIFTGCNAGSAVGAGLAAAAVGVLIIATGFDLAAVSDVEPLLAAITERLSELSWARTSGVDGFASRLQAASARAPAHSMIFRIGEIIYKTTGAGGYTEYTCVPGRCRSNYRSVTRCPGPGRQATPFKLERNET